MTSTGTFQGLGGDSRISSKVLKPPGGGSSDIFGAAPEETSPRRINNHNHSQLGSALFGDGAPKNNGSSTGTTSPDSPRGNKPDGNPVTGTGYTSDPQNNITTIQNGVSASNMNGSEKSSDISPAGSTKGQQSRARVPPGGYSSGLW